MFLEGSTLEVRLGREELRLSLLGKKGERLLTSAAAWEPHEIDGVETYTLLMIWPGIRALWRDLSAAYRQEFGSALEETEKCIVRGMGGGYMPFDPRLSVLTAYRGAWDPCPEAAAELGDALGRAVPAGGAAAHLWQAVRDGEAYLPYVDFVTTLPGYVHWRLTGRRVVDRAAAAGIFPLDGEGQFDRALLRRFDELASGRLPKPLGELLPEVLPAGCAAGSLMRESLRMLDPSGDLREGIPFLTPEEE